MIAIRTKVSTDIGIGHIVRMQHLSKEFQSLGKNVVFILDYPVHNISTYVKSANVIYLSDEKIKYSQVEDAKKVISLLKNKPVEMIILDSYELSIEWENIIKDEGYELAVIDDILRKHNCDFIIDQKYARENTNTQYDDLVPDNCIKLLGPRYAILSDHYQDNIYQKKTICKVLFSLGGGGDLNLIANLVGKFDDSKIIFQIVIGPLAKGKKKIRELAKEHKSIQLIENEPILYPYYKEASLFIGALGTSFYECRALKIPAITFSLSMNQVDNEEELNYLEDYGHYLHIDLKEIEKTENFISLISTVCKQINRIEELSNTARINIDGLGTKRIVSSLCDSVKPVKINYDSTIVLNKDMEYLNSGLSIRKVIDSDINHYLYARNLQKNRQNMTINQPISKLEHYNWWFNNQRESYLLIKSNEKKLYIWHQKVIFKKNGYLIGGWFVCDDNTSFEIAAAALEWQLKMTAKIHPNYTWIAIIKKTNKYVNLLNKYMGFVNVKEGEEEYFAIKDFFNNPSFNEYNYVKYSLNDQGL